MSRRAAALASLLIPGAAALLLFRGLIFFGELPFRRDMGLLFVPLKRVLGASLRSGTLPEWWPWDGLGMPFVSVPVLSTFHPSTVLFVILPFQPAFVLQILLAVPVGLLGTWWLGRALGLRPAFAGFAATGYVLGAYFLGLTEFTSMSLAAAALPWLWWGALRCRRSGRLRPLAIGFAVAWMLLAGDPHLAIMGLLGASALVLRWTRPQRLVRPAASLVLGTVLGVALSAVQVLPALLLFGESPRSTGKGIVSSEYWSLDAVQLLGMLSPGALEGREYMFLTTYAGLSIAFLALVGASIRGRARPQLVAIGVVSIVLALGSATPLWAAFSAVIPFWSAFQFPIKAIGPAMLVVPLLAARGAQMAVSRGVRRFVPALAVAVAVPVALVLGPLSAALLTVSTAASLAALGWRPRTPALPYLLLGAVALDLALANGHLAASASVSTGTSPPIAEALRRQGVSGEGYSYLNIWQPTLPQRKSPEFERVQASALVPLTGASYGLPTSNVYLQGFSARYQELVLDDKQSWVSGLAGAYGTRFVIANPSMFRPDQRSRAIAYDAMADAMAVPLRRSMPRAYVVRGAKVLPRDEVLPYVRTSFRPGREVVLEAPSADAMLSRQAGGDAKAADSVRRIGDVLEVEVTLDEPGYLVVNESYFEGVEATANGVPVQVLPANHAVRAIAVNAGHTLVRFEYRTPGLVAGALVSGLTLLVLVAFAAMSAIRETRGSRVGALGPGPRPGRASSGAGNPSRPPLS